MSRKSARHRHAHAKNRAAIAAHAAAAAFSGPAMAESPAPAWPSAPGGGSTGISAADHSASRGYIYFPNLAGKHQFKSHTRRETIKRSQWLTWNTGPARVLRRLARWIGAVSVIPATADRRWNRQANAWWRRQFEDTVGNYEASGKFTASGFLINNTWLQMRDGDCLGVHAVDAEERPVAAIFESLLVDSPNNRPEDGWIDGVLADGRHRALKFSLRDDADWPRSRHVEIDARSAHLFANYETHASRRGTPALVHAVPQLLDFREIDNDVRKIIKVHGLVGFAVTRDLPQNGGAPAPAVPISGRTTRTTLPAVPASGNTAAQPEVKRDYQQVFDSAEIMDLPAGMDIKPFTDGRNDFPAQTELKNDIYLQVALGLGIPVELLFLLDKLTGPGIRFVLRQAQEWRQDWLDRQVPWLKVDYARRVEHAVRTGELPECRDPYFWNTMVRYPRAITIDDGRTAKAQIERLRAGLTNFSTEYGEQGDDWMEEVPQLLDELQFIWKGLRKRDLPPQLMFQFFRDQGLEEKDGAEEEEDADGAGGKKPPRAGDGDAE